MIIEMRSRVWRWLAVGCGLLAAVNAFVVTPTYPKYSKGIYGTVINDVDLLTTADLKISTRSSESLQPHTDQDTTTSNTEMRPNQHPTEFISNELYTMQEVVTTSTTTSDKTAYDLAVMLLSALLYLPSLDFLERYSFSLLTHDRVEEVTNLVVDAHFIPQDYHKWTSFPSPNLPVVKQVVDKVKRINKAIIDKNNALNKYKLQQKVHSSMTTRNLFRLHFPSLTLSKESLCVVVEDTSILINDKAKIVGVVELYPLSPVYLCNLSIDKSYRRSGLAYVLCQLMEIIVQTCWNESEMMLEVEPDNIAAQKLYEKLGYQRNSKWFMTIADRPFGSYQRRSDLIAYSKVLQLKEGFPLDNMKIQQVLSSFLRIPNIDE